MTFEKVNFESANQSKKVCFRLMWKPMKFSGLHCLNSSEATIQITVCKRFAKSLINTSESVQVIKVAGCFFRSFSFLNKTLLTRDVKEVIKLEESFLCIYFKTKFAKIFITSQNIYTSAKLLFTFFAKKHQFWISIL